MYPTAIRPRFGDRFMANISSLPHFGGHAILAGWGLLGGNMPDVIAGGIFLAATGAKAVLGHKDKGMQASALLSLAGICVLTVPAISAGDMWALAANATTTAGLCYGFFGHWLDARFAHASSQPVRFILGQPRQRLRDAFLIGKVPTVIFAVTTKNWPLLAAQAVYAAGDVMLGFSKVEAKQGQLLKPEP